MKKLLLILPLFLLGCDPGPPVRTSQNTVVYTKKAYDTVCHDGVVYVNFSNGNGSWGGAKFDPLTSKVVTCK